MRLAYLNTFGLAELEDETFEWNPDELKLNCYIQLDIIDLSPFFTFFKYNHPVVIIHKDTKYTPSPNIIQKYFHNPKASIKQNNEEQKTRLATL